MPISPESTDQAGIRRTKMSETMIIKRSGQAPLRVRGELLADQSSSTNNASSAYSGSVGRSQSVQVYKTAGGKYVVSVKNETCWQGEHDTYDAVMFPSITQCIKYLADLVPEWLLSDIIDEIGEEEVAENVD